jgi:tRNA(Arg) A34 adenosine deaminase TadA
MTQNERWMEYAFREAEKAFDQNEVPVGVHNCQREQDHREGI